jgi:Anti-sigma-K factor rskA
MSDRDLRELVGDDLTPEEWAQLERVDRLLRSVPPPPAEVPGSLVRAVERIGEERPAWTTRRFVAAVALAAALSALFFAVGRWTTGGGPEYGASVPMRATDDAPGASAVIKLAGRDEATGNSQLQLRVSGLPRLTGDAYYVLWLAKDGQYAATCGTFNVGDGTTTVDMTVSYRLADYDAWVVSRHGEDTPWLLTARIGA